jgi:uncharacterized protein (DUF885 family)
MSVHSRRAFLLSAVAASALTGCATTPTPAAAPRPEATAPVQLHRLLDAFFEEALADSPELVTRLGLDKGDRADAKSRLDDRSLAELAREKRRTAQQLRRLKAVDRSALSGMDAVNYDAVLYGLAGEDEADRRFSYGDAGAGSPYVLSQLNGAYQSVPDFLGSQHVIETGADADAYLARLQQFAALMDQDVERARHDAGLGVVPPDFVIDRALGQMQGLRAPPATSPLVTSVADRASAKGIAGDYGRQAAGIYADSVLPALERQIAFMRGLRLQAVHDAGVWRLPDGEAYYRLSLRRGSTTDMTPDEVHQMGLDQARVLGERADALLRAQGMTQGPVGKRLRALYANTRYRYPNTDPGKARLIADLNAQVRAMQAKLPQYFATLPKAPVEIRRVPKFIEAGAPGGYYNAPSLDGARPGIYWINLRDTAEKPSWTLPTLTYHEAIPGHHLQISLQQEADLPMIRRTAVISAYVEGWALYAENLAQEMGVYADDPLGELGFLQAALFRAARPVVDTGLHARRWTREQAIQVMCDIDGDPPSTAATEVERYCVWPGQAVSYMIGKLTWLRLRDKAKAALGPRFDLRKFHDAGLLSGAMPLTVLEPVIDCYIAAAKG